MLTLCTRGIPVRRKLGSQGNIRAEEEILGHEGENLGHDASSLACAGAETESSRARRPKEEQGSGKKGSSATRVIYFHPIRAVPFNRFPNMDRGRGRGSVDRWMGRRGVLSPCCLVVRLSVVWSAPIDY